MHSYIDRDEPAYPFPFVEVWTLLCVVFMVGFFIYIGCSIFKNCTTPPDAYQIIQQGNTYRVESHIRGSWYRCAGTFKSKQEASQELENIKQDNINKFSKPVVVEQVKAVELEKK